MIPFLDLKINEPYEIAFQEKLKVVLATGWYILGNEVKESETSLPSIAGQYCIGTEMVWMLWF
jgi:hypothetical protein